MAYPTVSAPYGLKPVNLIGGQVFAGATRQIPVASGYNTSMFNGDVVKKNNAGVLIKEAGTTTANPVGVFLGCSYTDPVLKYQIYSQYFPANTVASDIVAYVSDDPDQLYKVALVSGTTVVATLARTAVGTNVALVQNAGDVNTGNSAVAALTGSSATTISLPLRIIDVVPETATATDAFVEVIVKWNEPYFTLAEGTPNAITWAGGHQYRNPLGV
tara:strand:- start:495 stop:1142 length:648 start_codon:yes stop_codon:yes gene_type:complete